MGWGELWEGFGEHGAEPPARSPERLIRSPAPRAMGTWGAAAGPGGTCAVTNWEARSGRGGEPVDFRTRDFKARPGHQVKGASTGL